jgi:hypothetical protein
MAGVHDGRDLAPQVDARDLTGHEPAPPGEIAEPGIRQGRLFGEPGTGPARVAERADQHRGETGGPSADPDR